MKLKSTISILLCCLIIFSCKKEDFIYSSDATIQLTADTLRFDTVFTNTGSITQSFKIVNTNNQKLLIQQIALKGGNASAFKINADGFPGPQINDIEVEANDSVYVFVTVTINPNSANLPFVIRDSIQINYNGNEQFLQLEAWGQNARFLRNARITGNTTWNNQLPYVILGPLQIDSNAILTIEKGTKLFFHADAPMIVDGTLIVNGEKWDSTRVVFQADRLDAPYNQFPGSWPGIYFRGKSKNNQLSYAIIKNAYQGIISEQPSINAQPKIVLNACIIDNIYDIGIYGIQTSIVANNCLVSNCGKNMLLIYGGQYSFTHCTIATMANNYIAHKDPLLQISNSAKLGNTIVSAALNAQFQNCIFWAEGGAIDDEVVTGKEGNTPYVVQFSNCLWKVKTNPAFASYNNIINNIPPEFDSIDASKRIYNFRLKSISPAINKGSSTSLPFDLDGNPRSVAAPDMGSYERQ